MDEPFTSSFDNSSAVTAFNSAVEQPTTLRAPDNQSALLEIAAKINLCVSSIALIVNAVVLVVLFRARRQFGSSVHTLIANQSALDLYTAIMAIPVCVMMLTDGFKYNRNPILDGAICVIFDGSSLMVVGLTAEKLGLVVITLERYFKIVHAIAHRKYYRSWMTKVGVALPWIGGVCLILFPAMGATRIVNGLCVRMGVWPNEAMAMAFAVVRFLFHYAIPVSVFVYCYGHIFHTIRRQSKVLAGHAGRGQDAGVASTSRDPDTGQVQQQVTGATTSNKLSRREMNVLKTMITIIICYMIFWTFPAIANLLQLLGVAALSQNAMYIAGSLGFISFSVNPIIYASRYEVFRRYLKQMLRKSSIASGNNDGVTNTNRPPRV